MKKFLPFVMIVALVLMLSSCATKQSALNDLRDLTTELQQHSDDYETHDWKMAIYRYRKINKDIRKHDYNNAEMEEIGTLRGKCVGVFTQAAANKAAGVVGMLKGFAGGLKEQLNLDGLLNW